MTKFFTHTLNLFGKAVDSAHTFRLAGGCGTAACLAGWAIHLDKKNKKLVDSVVHNDALSIADRARRILGLSELQADRLFYISSWPKRFTDAYRGRSTKNRAIAAGKRIDYFIRTGK